MYACMHVYMYLCMYAPEEQSHLLRALISSITKACQRTNSTLAYVSPEEQQSPSSSLWPFCGKWVLSAPRSPFVSCRIAAFPVAELKHVSYSRTKACHSCRIAAFPVAELKHVSGRTGPLHTLLFSFSHFSFLLFLRFLHFAGAR